MNKPEPLEYFDVVKLVQEIHRVHEQFGNVRYINQSMINNRFGYSLMKDFRDHQRFIYSDEFWIAELKNIGDNYGTKTGLQKMLNAVINPKWHQLVKEALYQKLPETADS